MVLKSAMTAEEVEQQGEYMLYMYIQYVESQNYIY